MKWSYVPRWKFTDSCGRPRVPGAHCRLAMTAIALWCLALVVPGGHAVAQPVGLERIQHLIVIYQENWSFDSLYGKFPGADGIANAGERVGQMKKDGTPYTTFHSRSIRRRSRQSRTLGSRRICPSLLMMRPNMFRLIRRQGTSSTGLFKSSFRSTAAEWTGS